MASMREKKQTVFTVSNDTHEQLWTICRRKGIRAFTEVEKALRWYIDKDNKTEARKSKKAKKK